MSRGNSSHRSDHETVCMQRDRRHITADIDNVYKERDTHRITAVIDNVYAERHTSYHSRH